MKKILMLGAVLVLSACSTNCFQKVASTRAAVLSGIDNTATLLDAEVINKDEAEKARTGLKGAWILTNNAAPMCSVDNATAGDYLDQAQVLVRDINEQILKGE